MTKKKDIRWQRPVMCVEDGRVWPCMRACSIELGIPWTTLRQCVNRRGSTHGLHFVDASDEVIEQYIKSKQIKVGDKVYLRNQPDNPGIVESIDGDVARFKFDSPIEYCECMREQLVKVESDEEDRSA